MSHVVTIRTQVRDPAAVAAACRRLGLADPVHGTAPMYAGQSAEGLLVQLPGWKFPLAIDTSTGELKGDNFRGLWGEPAELDRFLQMYAIEKTKLEARRAGHTVTETRLADGSVKLQLLASV